LAQCPIKVTGWGGMFICGVVRVLRCSGSFYKTRLEPEQLQWI